jgi:hypothetical protein
MQEAEIRRIAVRSQPTQIVGEWRDSVFSFFFSVLGIKLHQPYFCECFFRVGSFYLPGLALNCELPDLQLGETLISKIPNTKKGCWSGSSDRALPSKCEALSSNPSMTKTSQATLAHACNPSYLGS